MRKLTDEIRDIVIAGSADEDYDGNYWDSRTMLGDVVSPDVIESIAEWAKENKHTRPEQAVVSIGLFKSQKDLMAAITSGSVTALNTQKIYKGYLISVVANVTAEKL